MKKKQCMKREHYSNGYIPSGGTPPGMKGHKKVLALAVMAALMTGFVPAWATDVTGQSKIIDMDTNATTIYGGVSEDGAALNNHLSFTGGTITLSGDESSRYPEIGGGYGKNGNGNGNTLEISGEVSVTGKGDASIFGGKSTNGDANTNKVLIRNGRINGDYLQGGQSYKGNANGNEVSIENGNIAVRNIVGGDGNRDANANTISITGGTITVDGSFINGGRTYYGNANENVVSISGDAELEMDDGEIYGGKGWEHANSNRVYISTSKAVTGVYRIIGGEGRYEANNNSIAIMDSQIDSTVSSGKYWDDYLLAGYSWSGTAERNSLSIGGSAEITASGIAAGYGRYGTKGNIVSIDDQSRVSTLGIAGGLAIDEDYYNPELNKGIAADNTVSINGDSTVSALGITGGLSIADEGIARQNSIRIEKGASVTAPLMGGGTGRTASDNLVDIQGTHTGFLVGGGGAFNLDYPLSEDDYMASGNVVNLNGAALVPLQTDDKVFKNPLVEELKEKITDRYEHIGDLSNYLRNPGTSIHVAGGVLMLDGEARQNAINLSGSANLSQSNLYGWITGPELLKSPFDRLAGRPLADDNHSDNTLNVGYISGWMEDEEGNRTLQGKASEWKGSDVQGICNFDKIAFYNVDISRPALTVTDTVSLPEHTELNLDEFMPSNTGHIVRDAILIDASKAETGVKGLDALYADGDKKYQNKDLSWDYADGGVTVTGSSELSLSEDNIFSYGFKSLDSITYHTINWETDGTVLTLDKTKDFDLTKTTVHTEDLDFTAKSLEHITQSGTYSMTLLDTQGNTSLLAENLMGKQGTWNISNALEGSGTASLDTNGNVIYTMNTVDKQGRQEVEVETTKQTHNALIANEAALGIVTAGRDRLDGVLENVHQEDGGLFTFASLGGSKDKYDTGSHSTAHIWNGLVGVGNEMKLANGEVSYGLFYEYGRGNYDVDGGGYHGSGDAHYNGGGLMARYTSRHHQYVEGSLRFGQVKNSADSVLHSRSGNAYGYETDSSYWSGHIGFGRVFDLRDETASESRGGIKRASRDLDVYGKYFYTHMDGDSFRAGDVTYNLDDLNSSLLRIGARVNNRIGLNDFYYGLAWDYEFDGESDGSVSAAGLQAPIRQADIGGSSLMAELGWKREATPDNPWDVNLGLRAYAGQHKGIGGSVFIGYHF